MKVAFTHGTAVRFVDSNGQPGARATIVRYDREGFYIVEAETAIGKRTLVAHEDDMELEATALRPLPSPRARATHALRMAIVNIHAARELAATPTLARQTWASAFRWLAQREGIQCEGIQ